MTDPVAAVVNLCAKAARRLGSAHKHLVRSLRHSGRERERRAHAVALRAVEQEVAACVERSGPVIAGPWLAEVGYEVLYWVPFLRWVRQRFRVRAKRLTVISRGGCEHWYRGIASRYVDVFDALDPAELADLNDERSRTEERGGLKQSALGVLDTRLLDQVYGPGGYDPSAVLHPSLLFRLFRNVWHGNLPLDDLWSRTEYSRMDAPPRPPLAGLPADYVAVRLYAGTALPDLGWTRDALGAIVRDLAEHASLVLLDTPDRFDDHRDYRFDDLPNTVSARDWMQARTNLGVQTSLVAHARCFVGTCGGLAWLAPMLGVPTVALYADDRLLAPHLVVAREAGRRIGAADLLTVDLRALDRLGLVRGRNAPAMTGTS